MSSLWSTAKKKVFGIHELQTQKVSDRKRGQVKIKSLSYQKRSLTAALRYSKLAILITADKAMTIATTGRLPARYAKGTLRPRGPQTLGRHG